MKNIYFRLLLLASLGGWLAPARAWAQHPSHEKNILLNRAMSAFRLGTYPEGLACVRGALEIDPTDGELRRLYRLNAGRYALRVSEECDMDRNRHNCDSALKYIEVAKEWGDSTVYHEVRAAALYQKVLALEEADFTHYRESIPERILTRDYCYRYLPEERKLFYYDLIRQATEEIRIARGDIDRHDKLTELGSKSRVIERSLKMVGTR